MKRMFSVLLVVLCWHTASAQFVLTSEGLRSVYNTSERYLYREYDGRTAEELRAKALRYIADSAPFVYTTEVDEGNFVSLNAHATGGIELTRTRYSVDFRLNMVFEDGMAGVSVNILWPLDHTNVLKDPDNDLAMVFLNKGAGGRSIFNGRNEFSGRDSATFKEAVERYFNKLTADLLNNI